MQTFSFSSPFSCKIDIDRVSDIRLRHPQTQDEHARLLVVRKNGSSVVGEMALQSSSSTSLVAKTVQTAQQFAPP